MFGTNTALSYILSGATVAFISNFLFTMRNGAFRFSGEFKSKNDATLIYSIYLISAGVATEIVSQIYRSILSNFGILFVLSITAILLRIVVNEKSGWNHDDGHSLTIYLIGSIIAILSYFEGPLI